MKNYILYFCIAITGLFITSCSNSESDPYWPDPSKGDYVTVVSVRNNLLAADGSLLHGERQNVSYNINILPITIDVYDTTNENPLVLYKKILKYSDKMELITIEVDSLNNKEGVDLSYSVMRNGQNIVKFENSNGPSVEFEYNGADVVKSIVGNNVTEYQYDSEGNIVLVSSNEGIYQIAYNSIVNPFIYTKLNLYLNYIPGAKDLEFLNRSTKAIQSITNLQSGEVTNFDYKVDQFGYPYLMEGFVENIKTTMTYFSFEIYREL